MNLTNYQNVNAKKKTTKYVHTENSSTSKGAKLVINTDYESANYEFLLFPVDSTKSSDSDFYYIIHTQSGYVLGIADGSSDEKKKVVLAKISGKYDQHWKFTNMDANGFSTIENRLSGYAWKLENSETSDGTYIKQVTNNKTDAYFFKFNKQVDQEDTHNFKSIPDPNLVGYVNRSSYALNDVNLVPEASNDPSSYNTTAPVLIGECSIPYYMVNDDNHRSLSLQVSETPYYVISRSQQWKFLENIDIPANTSYAKTVDYQYGASQTVINEFTSITDWTLGAELSVGYGGISGGISGSVGQSLEIFQSTTTHSYEETNDHIEQDFGTATYDRTYIFWQIVDIIELKDGLGNTITSMKIPGDVTCTTCYAPDQP